ncbi:MAG TPA: redoxin domain-containing protein [Chitinophagaceae bacterium]|nr:redoxin domain-containing protein [Chitinophagaceae bacterium]
MRILSLIVFSLFPLLSFSQGTPKQVPGTEGQKTHPEAPINSTIPVFQYITSSGKFITDSDLPKNKPIVMALFNPTCDHCQKAIVEMKEKNEQFKNVTIVFVSSIANYVDLDNFVKITGVSTYPNFYICAAQDNFITSYFMPNWILPQVMVYNKQRKLKKIFYETINTDSLLTYLNK